MDDDIEDDESSGARRRAVGRTALELLRVQKVAQEAEQRHSDANQLIRRLSDANAALRADLLHEREQHALELEQVWQQQQQQQLMLGMGQAGLVGVIPGMPQVGALGLGAAGGIGLLQAMPQAGALTLGAATAAVHDSSKSSGKLKSFLPDKGFGFIQNHDGTKDIYFQLKELMNGGIADLFAGIELEYDVETETRSGKLKATNVTIFGRAAPSINGRRSGRLKSYLQDKAFGFIQNDDGSKDIYFQFKELTNGDVADLREGIRLEYDIEKESRSGKLKAVNVTIEGREIPSIAGKRTGKLKSYLPEKGFGFIANDDGGKDLFLNHTELS
eukprot:gnl/TRDRNA2_/TRDRNA2_173727_c1_seq5.p1 gnl/TRDRNA2_/TRDRNA2_173727_c1~~gnl/TRDRNA2_/TRDRNA2_173727_c1_seq5.p1  ORF type:complete len:330 (+),score=78.03 gnl/TRDRNA2_/TRDRNA2_173727_c1_seq5:49-1038(+)